MRPASIETAMYRQSLMAAGGTAPIIKSRAIPPELPAANDNTRTPNKSSLCLTPAVAPLSAKTKVPPRSKATSSVLTTICSLKTKRLIGRAKPEMLLPLPPLRLPKWGESPGRSAGCDWSGCRQSCPSSWPLHMSQDRCHRRTRIRTGPATQFQTSQNLRSLSLVACLLPGRLENNCEMRQSHALSPPDHSSPADNDREE